MPTHGDYRDDPRYVEAPSTAEPAWSGFFAADRQRVAAEVPAVRLSRGEWADLLSILRDLADLGDALQPRPVAKAVIDGSVIAGAVEKARGLTYLLKT